MMTGASSWLWLLFAVAVPVAVHLWNRKAGKPKLLGTFRFLPEESFAKAARMELHEVPLLVIRILLVITAVLLLADLFWSRDKPAVPALKITESKTGDLNEVRRQDDFFEMNISPEQLDKAGWWNIISQADYEYRPDLIIAEGDFSQNRFSYKRPELSADVEWIGSATEGTSISAIWQSPGDLFSVFIQEQNQQGAEYQIRNIEEFDIISPAHAVAGGDTVQFADSLVMHIQADAPQPVKNGLYYAAESWKIRAEEAPMDELIRVSAGDQVFSLHNRTDENGPDDFLAAGPVNGVRMKISQMDTTIRTEDAVLKSREYFAPVLWQPDSQTLVLNGTVTDQMRPWFYAGAAQQLIKLSLGFEQHVYPSMTADQRQISRNSQRPEAMATRQVSLRPWLFFLLILFWASERFLAPKRGM